MTATPFITTPAIRRTLQGEGAAIALFCIAFYAQPGASWGVFAALLLAPDLFMLGYLAGNRMGAICYNIAHSYVTPIILAAIGVASGLAILSQLALIWGAHIGLDRAIGYGLKYSTGFKDTHLNHV